MNTKRYDASMTLREVLETTERGGRVLCPECGAELVVAFDEDTLQRLQVHRGVYCSNDHNHVAILVDVRLDPGFWEQFEKKSPPTDP